MKRRHKEVNPADMDSAEGMAKEIIRKKFSRAARGYEEYAEIQRKCASRLLETLPSGFSPGNILEIGCGSGNYSRLLKSRYPEADLYALDFSEEMLNIARGKTRDGTITYLRRDAEKYLAGTDKKFSLITSNATLQWFKDLPGAFRNMAGKLQGNGLVHVSVFGAESLAVLAQALRQVVDPSLVLPSEKFADQAFLRKAASSHFSRLKIEEINFERRYASFLELLRQIHNTGTGGYVSRTPRFTRGVIAELDKYLAGPDGYTVNYQVFFLTASDPR